MGSNDNRREKEIIVAARSRRDFTGPEAPIHRA